MKLNRKHSTQIIIHTLFWALFVFVSLFVFTEYYWAENPFLQYFFLLVSIVYVNYFILLPYFVKKKWYALYSLLFTAISFLATQLYCNVFTRCGCSFLKCLSDYLWQTLVPLLFFSFLWMLFKYLDEQDKLEKATQERTEMELKFLKTQINPHVLLNNLNTIYAYSIEKPSKTPDLILKLSENLKHVLYETNSKKVSLKKELNFIENYIEFQRIRTEGIKEIAYHQTSDKTTYKIAPLLLITLIENAFKHSTTHSKIFIEINTENSVLNFTSSNTYKVESKQNNNAIGLENLRKRLFLLYPNNHQLTIDEQESLFTAKLTLNLE
ncbi:membrane protein [Tenacibaculum holothuriorum]|uniref:Membrane protein n=1 Tax=Tenacibaculum holothuriorum TaxID=1635173 RepID=A0A1Y2PFH9_9FLAO|nr:sensor histidine kinase [Tenacibaculum holothuriorum]OSY88930.1 membrane protein [Tenacibaculum holothuriorum]